MVALILNKEEQLEDSQKGIGQLDSFGLKNSWVEDGPIYLCLVPVYAKDFNLSAQNLFRALGTLSSLVHGRGMRFSRD